MIALSGLTGAALAWAPHWRAAAADPLEPRPRDAELDLGSVKIVAPEAADWRAAADRLADAVAATGVTRPQIVAPEEDRFAQGWSDNVLLLGHLGNNAELARLYGLRYAMVDSWLPGPGGHWVATVVNPFGLGGVTVVLGASDAAGAETAVTAVTDAFTGTALPRQHTASLTEPVLSGLPNKGVTDATYLAAQRKQTTTMLAALRPTVGVETDATKLIAFLPRLKLLGEAFLLTADPGFGELYHTALLGYARWVNANPEPTASQLDHSRNMWGEGDELISVWAMTETAELFTEEERLIVLTALRATFAVNAIENNLSDTKQPGPRWNHEAYPALSLVAGADYFWRHHRLPEAQVWMNRGSLIFTGNTAVISLDEGADYLMHLPVLSMDYALLTGQRSFLNRTVRPSADLNALMMDNAGGLVGGGDVYPYGASGPYTWGHSQVMLAAIWLYPEPIYSLLMERARTGPFSNNINTDLKFPLHRYLVNPEHDPDPDGAAPPAVMAYPVEEGVYDFVTDAVPSSVPRESSFHKLAFRAGLDIDAPTLMVDGFAGGTHNHQDTNAIIGYTAHQRILLTDRDYLESIPEHHSSLVVVRNGEQPVKAQLAAVDWVADVDGGAVSRTTVEDWAGTDWARTVVTTTGAFHVVIDDLTFNEDGDYLVKTQWQTLGIGELDGARYTCRQDGATMVIDSLDASVLQIHDRYGHFRKYWKGTFPYPYAEAETVLSQVVAEAPRRAGERLRGVNVIATAGEGIPAVESRRWNERQWQVTAAGQEWWFITEPIEVPGLRTDGTLTVVGPDRITIAGATTIRLSGLDQTFEQPVVWHLDTSAGTWAAFPVRRDLVSYDDNGTPVRPGPVAEGRAMWSSGQTQRLVGAVRATAQPWRAGAREDPLPTEVPDGWQATGAVSGTVTAIAAPQKPGDPILVGTAEGVLSAVVADGTTAWSRPLSGRINEISRHQYGDDRLIAVASEAWRIHALGEDGQQRWERRFSNDVAHREQKGNLLGVTNVRTGYVNGHDAAPWLMVGTQFRWVYGLDWAGGLKHESMVTFYGIEDAVFADLDGDGKDEGAYALEYFYPCVWDDGKEATGGSAGGAGFTSVAIHSPAGETPVIIYGTKQNVVRTYRYDPAATGIERLVDGWIRNVGGQVTTLVCDTHHSAVGEEILLGTTNSHVWSLAPDGTPRFRTNVGDSVASILPVPERGYLVAAANGLLVELDTAGNEVRRWRFPAPIAGVIAGPGADAGVTVVLTNGQLLRPA